MKELKVNTYWFCKRFDDYVEIELYKNTIEVPDEYYDILLDYVGEELGNVDNELVKDFCLKEYYRLAAAIREQVSDNDLYDENDDAIWHYSAIIAG